MAGVVAATMPSIAEAGQALLDKGGNAIDAALGCWLFAAARDDGVLLSPLIALVGGVGVGARCIDGRAVQPGAGGKRPRGFTDGEAVPPGAQIAVPRSLGAAAVLHAYGAARSLQIIARPALAAGAKGTIVEGFVRHGPSVLTMSDVQRALLRAASPTARGLLTEEDLAGARPADETRVFAPEHGWGVLRPGLETDAAERADPHPRAVQMIVAGDRAGRVVALCFRPDPEGLWVSEIGARLARDGVPVRRGVPRTTPRTATPCPAPIVLLSRQDGWYGAIGGDHTLAGRQHARRGARVGRLEAGHRRQHAPRPHDASCLTPPRISLLSGARP